MASKLLNKSLEWALTEEARQAIDQLVIAGLDYDLAFIATEESWPETEFYNVPASEIIAKREIEEKEEEEKEGNEE